MGEVYQARDTRLDRRIAIKVLPSEFSRSAALKARFEREAKAISALNHPNICTLHDIGHDGGVDYLVMEYLEGETLAERLRKGPLPIEQVLRYGVQIAAALDAAHRQGIVHRDLKPGNVMLTRAGAKLLDFGLAKESAFRPLPDSGITDLRTEQKALTAEGTIVGTFQYMAPEQLEGIDVDARTDIFALGTLLYEMTTGVRAFDGKTKTSIIAAIISSSPPPISSFQALTPPALEHVVRRCLAKSPDDRWQSAADIASELQWISEAGMEAVPIRRTGRMNVRRFLWPAGALLAGILLGAAAWSLRAPSSAQPAITHFDVAAPDAMRIELGNRRSFAIAPDESSIVFNARTVPDAESMLLLRRTSDFKTTELERNTDRPDVAYSPDGRWIAYASRGKVRKVAVDGGKPVDLCEVGSPVGIHWSGSTIVFNDDFTNGIWSIAADGGERKFLFGADASQKERAVIHPQLLPDGKHVLYTAWTGGSFDDADIAVRSLETGQRKVVMRGGSDARYLPTGHLVWGRAGSLLAVPFDLERLETKGSPVTVRENVATGSVNGEAHFSISNRGTLLFASGGAINEERELVWVDRTGAATPVVPTRRNYNFAKLSPDGASVALTIEGSTFDIWVLDIERDSMNRLSFGADDSVPTWSPDGKQLAWTSTRGGNSQVFVRAADGSGEERQLTSGAIASRMMSWSPDGKTFLIRRTDAKSSRGNVWMLPAAGGPPRPFRQNPWDELATFSRDGRWIALSSDESGRLEIYVMPAGGSGAKTKVSIDGGSFPAWSHDGREIFYRQRNKLFAARFDPSRMVTVGKPVMLFEGPYVEMFDVARDGRFLMVKVDENFRTATSYHAIAGWFGELERRVPTK